MIWITPPKEDIEKLERALYMYSIINPKGSIMWYKTKTQEEVYQLTKYDSLYRIKNKKKIWIHKLEEFRELTDKLYKENGFDKLEKLIRKKV